MSEEEANRIMSSLEHLSEPPAAKRPRTTDSGYTELRPSGKPVKAHLKMLVSNMAGGTLTGKGGSRIQELERNTGVKMQLSKQGQHYPGTSERVVLVSGNMDGLRVALERVVAVIGECADTGKDAASGTSDRIVVRLVLPNSCSSIVIGTGGSKINAMTERSGADIQFSEKGKNAVPDQRILSITGSLLAVEIACLDVLPVIQEDPHLAKIMTLEGSVSNLYLTDGPGQPPAAANFMPFHGNQSSQGLGLERHVADFRDNYGSRGGAQPMMDVGSNYGSRSAAPLPLPLPPPPGPPPRMDFGDNFGSHGASPMMDHRSNYGTSQSAGQEFGRDFGYGSSQSPKPVNDRGGKGSKRGKGDKPAKVSVEIAFDVSDMMAGTIVGKGGHFLKEVTRETRASVQLSHKNGTAPGLLEGMRRVVISGNLTAVHSAHIMVVDRMRATPEPGYEGPWGRQPGSVWA